MSKDTLSKKGPSVKSSNEIVVGIDDPVLGVWEGPTVGIEVGNAVGRIVGRAVGNSEGKNVGTRKTSDGCCVAVGLVDGVAEGTDDGK